MGAGNDAPLSLQRTERLPKGCCLATLVMLAVTAGCAGPLPANPERPLMPDAERAPRPFEAIEPRLRAVILQGQDLWRRPPVGENTIACATCHFDEAGVRGWAASFPKLKPLPPPFTRVMTLQQAVSQGIATHYRIPLGEENRHVARAITAYLTWTGEGRPVTPGVASDQPRFPERLAALRKSVARGQRLVGRMCAGCHGDTAGPTDVAATFPRLPRDGATVATLEEYLEKHAGIAWDSPQAADIAAYFAARARGRLLQPGGVARPSTPQGG